MDGLPCPYPKQLTVGKCTGTWILGPPEHTSPDGKTEEELSADIRLLDGLLGNAIRRLAGEEAFALQEEIRATAMALRAQPSVVEARRLCERLDRLELPALRSLVRAFSIYFDLINLAEQQARVRANRSRTLRQAPKPLPESLEAALRQLRDQGVNADQIRDLLERALICPVFTAHPSEARRRTILEKLGAIARHLNRIEYSKLLPRERELAVAAIDQTIETFWLSDTVRRRRPTVLDEVRQGLGVIDCGLMDVVLRDYRELERALELVYPEYWNEVGVQANNGASAPSPASAPSLRRVPALLRFGTWIGGDRDGHPDVNPAVTAKAIRLGRRRHSVII